MKFIVGSPFRGYFTDAAKVIARFRKDLNGDNGSHKQLPKSLRIQF
jgi:hypothetical protein